LTAITVGLYMLYFMVSRTDERNKLSDDILSELQRGGGAGNIFVHTDGSPRKSN